LETQQKAADRKFVPGRARQLEVGSLSLHSNFPDPKILFYSFDVLSDRVAKHLSPRLDIRNLVVRDLPTIKCASRYMVLVES
jgi:hypothetical protein